MAVCRNKPKIRKDQSLPHQSHYPPAPAKAPMEHTILKASGVVITQNRTHPAFKIQPSRESAAVVPSSKQFYLAFSKIWRKKTVMTWGLGGDYGRKSCHPTSGMHKNYPAPKATVMRLGDTDLDGSTPSTCFLHGQMY